MDANPRQAIRDILDVGFSLVDAFKRLEGEFQRLEEDCSHSDLVAMVGVLEDVVKRINETARKKLDVARVIHFD